MSGLRRRARGAVALEYILITAIVAIALIAAFKFWGRRISAAVRTTSGTPVGGYSSSTGVGGALSAP